MKPQPNIVTVDTAAGSSKEEGNSPLEEDSDVGGRVCDLREQPSPRVDLKENENSRKLSKKEVATDVEKISKVNMLSCAPPAPTMQIPGQIMKPIWGPLMQPESTVKIEPVEDEAFPKEQTSGFDSDGFHSASPSFSSKDSNGQSPRSVDSPSDTSHFFENYSIKKKSNLSAHMDLYGNPSPYNILSIPGYEQSKDTQEHSPKSDNAYSPQTMKTLAHVSTPISKPDICPGSSSPPGSPNNVNDHHNSDRFHDSGLDGVSQFMNKESEDSRDESGLDDFEDEPGFRVPAVNSHGKVKTFKCKQCQFVAVTKLDFWEHSRVHIKPEKMLCCKKCPFVTEYKHHLEYHIRNHSGSKPFQCTQCSYSCVNKSMLNSHLKSHSNIYQYRCANCNYATKYCHSLKLHLRKYKHKPDVVLNMDGTPNPLPIIDVYGTRRGPKQKSFSKQFERVSINNNIQTQHLPHPIFPDHYSLNLPYLSPLLPPAFMFPPNNNYRHDLSPKLSPVENNQTSSPIQQQPSFGVETAEAVVTPPPASTHLSVKESQTPDSPENNVHMDTNDALDLTRTKPREVTPTPVDKPTSVTPTTLKNRRKGPAYKLQPAALRFHNEDDRKRETSESESEVSAEVPSSTATAPGPYSCNFCRITFDDLTMHTIHMGFHGFNDPFMCNKCGENCSDRVAFFIHLCRTPHF